MLYTSISFAGIVGDTNGDGVVDISEALYTLKIAAGNVPDLPDSCAITGYGLWEVGKSYQTCDVVQKDGSFYICIQSHTSSELKSPSDENVWAILALRGDIGLTGLQGPQGDKGDTGEQGLTGAIGPEGPQGIQGDVGPQGLKGDKGETGAIGPEGPQGIQGLVGADGPIGPQGPIGLTGPQGEQGIQGPTGLTGDTGPKGDTGDIGPQGIQGDIGPQGIAGVKGDTGERGLTGAIGPEGPTGPQGEQGIIGLTGPKGDAGDQGPQGEQGDSGTFQDGTSAGEILYWNGTEWVAVAPGSNGNILTFRDGVPIWVIGSITCGAYVAPGVWKQFDCYNLAAIGKTTNDDPFTPSWRLNGGYWQWGRKGIVANGPTGPDLEDANSGEISGWDTTYAPDGSWSDDSKTANDPCPVGYRVPTHSQWNGVIINNTYRDVGSWTERGGDGTTNYSAARFYGNDLMLPIVGARDQLTGFLFHHGYQGNYWSSTQGTSETWARYIGLIHSWNPPSNHTRRTGLSVRCVAE